MGIDGIVRILGVWSTSLVRVVWPLGIYWIKRSSSGWGLGLVGVVGGLCVHGSLGVRCVCVDGVTWACCGSWCVYRSCSLGAGSIVRVLGTGSVVRVLSISRFDGDV